MDKIKVNVDKRLFMILNVEIVSYFLINNWVFLIGDINKVFIVFCFFLLVKILFVEGRILFKMFIMIIIGVNIVIIVKELLFFLDIFFLIILNGVIVWLLIFNWFKCLVIIVFWCLFNIFCI